MNSEVCAQGVIAVGRLEAERVDAGGGLVAGSAENNSLPMLTSPGFRRGIKREHYWADEAYGF